MVEALGLGTHLYADDTQLYGHCSPSNSVELASRVLRAIDSIHEWMSSNRLSLNTSKTQFIWLGTKHSLAKRDTDRLSSLHPSLTELTSVRNLGFHHWPRTLHERSYYQNSPSRVITSSVKYVQFGIHLHKLSSKPWSTPSSAHASILQTASSMGQARTSLTVSSRSSTLLHVWSSKSANTIRSRLQFDGTSIGFPIRFRVHFKLNSITSNCLAGRAPEYLTELCHSVNDIPARRNLRSSSQVQLLVPRFSEENDRVAEVFSRLLTTAMESPSCRYPTSPQRTSTF